MMGIYTEEQLCLAENAVFSNLGEGLRIAILDTGVDWNHPMLEGCHKEEDVRCDVSSNCIQFIDTDEPDPFGHGTAVASVIYRLLPKAKLGSIRVLAGDARGASSVVHEGAKYGIRQGYQVLHCSFGSQILARLPKFKQWIDAAYTEGVHVVAASSNLGVGRTDYPSHFPTVLSVSGKSATNGYALGFLEKYLVQLCMPADGFYVAWKEHGAKLVGGTSFAAPIVTALAGRLLQTWPDANPLELKALMLRLAQRELDITDLLRSAGIVQK